jgi:hypothetical protein
MDSQSRLSRHALWHLPNAQTKGDEQSLLIAHPPASAALVATPAESEPHAATRPTNASAPPRTTQGIIRNMPQFPLRGPDPSKSQ